MEKIRKRYRFYGRVQGVGFRYRSQYAAQMVGVTGWVKNEYDESVEMEVQGTSKQIDDMLLMIEKGPFIRIDNMEFQRIETIQESSFRIR